jgi:hypothetical protein
MLIAGDICGTKADLASYSPESGPHAPMRRPSRFQALFLAQRDHGIDSARSTRRHVAGDECRSKEHQTNSEQHGQAQCTCSVKRTLHGAAERIRASEPQRQPARGKRQARRRVPCGARSPVSVAQPCRS